MKSNKILSLVLVIILTLSILIVGCSQKQKPTADTGQSNQKQEDKNTDNDSAKKDEKVELRIAWWGSQDRHDRTMKVIDMFKEANKNIEIEPEFAGWDGYWEKIASQAAANNMPDIMQHDQQYLKQYVLKNLLVNLDPYVESKIIDLTNVDESSLIEGRINDHLYAINLGNNSLTIAYDPELFKKAGVDDPTPDWTWEDYKDKTKTIKDKLGIYGGGSIAGGYYHGLIHYLLQHGYSIYSEDITKLGYTDDKLFEDFFTIELELVKAGALPPSEVRIEIKSVEDNLIVKQKAAMAEIHSNQLIAMAKAAERPLKLALLPKSKDQTRNGQYIKASQFFAVTSSSKNPEIAAKFIDFFTNDVEANKILMAERGVPISSKVREALLPSLDENQKEAFNFIDLVIKNSISISSDYRIPPDPPGAPEVDQLLKNLEEQMLFDKITPQEAAKKFRQEATAILEKAAK